MEKDFEEYISRRCSEALEENAEYMNNEYNEKLTQDELQIMAEKLCYKKGYSNGYAEAMATLNIAK
jgi:hypothetical protein